MARLLEERLPFLLAVLAGLLAGAKGPSRESMGRIVSDVLPITIGAASVLAGFLGISLSVMLALIDSSIVKSLRVTGHFQRLVGYFWASVSALCLYVGVALALLLLRACEVRLPWHERTAAASVAFTSVWALLACRRVGRLLVKLLQKNAEQ